MDVPEISYETEDFSDILKKDARFDSRAYDFVLRVIAEASEVAKGHVSGQELLGFFRDLALDAYGPLAYTVLTTWGLTCCEDVGAIVFNLYNALVYDVADILDTYIYRRTFVSGLSFSSSAAQGIFKSVINLILLVTANTLTKKISGQGIY